MKNDVYISEFNDEIIVERYSIQEALKLAIETINGIEFQESMGARYIDDSVYIEYKDGTYYNNCQGDITGKFKKSNIKGIVIDCAGSCWQIAGKYIMNDNLIPELI